MFSMSFFERQAYRHNISAVFFPSQIHEKLISLLDSKIENFQTKFPNFLHAFSANQKQLLLNDLFVLNAYDFVTEKLFRVVSQMSRPLDEIHRRASEVEFLMQNYSGLRDVYIVLMLFFRKGKLKPHQLLSTEVVEALTTFQEKHQFYVEHEFLLFILIENHLFDDELIVSALQTSQPHLLSCIFDIYNGICSPKMAYQFFEYVKNWESQSAHFLKQQLQLLKAMEFFKENNHRHLLESGLFDWNKTSMLTKQVALFKSFHPNAPHFESILATENPAILMRFLLKNAHVFMKNPETIEHTLSVFFKLVSIYPESLDINILVNALSAAFKFNNILDDLKHPVLEGITVRMWQKLIDIALMQQTDIDEKGRRFIECMEQGKRFMNYEINTFSVRTSPVSIAEPLSPKLLSFESEDLDSLQRSWPK